MAVPRSLLHIDGADEASLSACFWGSASAWLIEQKKKKKCVCVWGGGGVGEGFSAHIAQM